MKHILTSVVAVVCSLTWALPSRAHDVASQIVGVWKIKSVESLDVQSKEVHRPFGDSPLSFFVFSKGGKFLKGNSYGNYKVEGSKVTIAYDRSTTMQDIGEATLVREVEVEGNVMTLKSAPIVNRMIGKTLVFIWVAEKVE